MKKKMIYAALAGLLMVLPAELVHTKSLPAKENVEASVIPPIQQHMEQRVERMTIKKGEDPVKLSKEKYDKVYGHEWTRSLIVISLGALLLILILVLLLM